MTKCNSRRARTGGLTLIELVVALFISGIVISAAMFSWTFISRHTTLQKRKSAFYAQTEQAAALIVNDIRTSPHVLFFDDNAITLVARNGGDTLTYRLTGDSLRKNDIAVRFFSEGATPVKFSIEKDKSASSSSTGPASDPRAPQDIIIVITLRTQDRTGLTSEIRSSVKIRYAEEEGNVNNKFKWNY
jgi:prepilin-type N-terminal cleavage/methylation domain-containing protein